MNLKNYTWTKHADSRLMERFLIPKSGRQQFLEQFSNNGGYFVGKRQNDQRDMWQCHDITIITDPETQTIITVYHNYQETLINNEELKRELAVQAVKYKLKLMRENSEYFEKAFSKLAINSRTLKNTHLDVVDKAIVDMHNLMVEVDNRWLDVLNKAQEAQKIYEKEY